MTRETRQLEDAEDYRTTRRSPAEQDPDRLLMGMSSQVVAHEVALDAPALDLMADELQGFADYMASGAAYGYSEAA